MKTFFLIFLFWCVAVLTDAVSFDTATTKELEEVIKKNDFILSVNNIKPKRKTVETPDELFKVDFPGSKQKFSLKLDRQTKRVIVETYEDGLYRNQYFNVDTLQEDSIIRSLILAINQSQPGAHATLYLDCISYGKIATPKSLRDMYNSMALPKLEVSREKKYSLIIDDQKDLRLVFSKNECILEAEDDYDDSFNVLQDEPFIGDTIDNRTDNRKKINIEDVSENDADNDKIINQDDNCPYISNMDQSDKDSDGVGDVCDNCPNHYNPNQKDTDLDQKGDVCDEDLDNDGIINTIDNCSTLFNPAQKDGDRDGIGDVCDNCSAGDDCDV